MKADEIARLVNYALDYDMVLQILKRTTEGEARACAEILGYRMDALSKAVRVLVESSRPAAPTVPPEEPVAAQDGTGVVEDALAAWRAAPCGRDMDGGAYASMTAALRAYHARLEDTAIANAVYLKFEGSTETESQFVKRVLAAAGKELLGGKP